MDLGKIVVDMVVGCSELRVDTSGHGGCGVDTSGHSDHGGLCWITSEINQLTSPQSSKKQASSFIFSKTVFLIHQCNTF